MDNITVACFWLTV